MVFKTFIFTNIVMIFSLTCSINKLNIKEIANAAVFLLSQQLPACNCWSADIIARQNDHKYGSNIRRIKSTGFTPHVLFQSYLLHIFISQWPWLFTFSLVHLLQLYRQCRSIPTHINKQTNEEIIRFNKERQNKQTNNRNASKITNKQTSKQLKCIENIQTNKKTNIPVQPEAK